ncbi:MAG TPA: type III secretion system inner membrane ring subunit SctD [Ramlibacter sp.]|nr:type III secretion system inner membrane ring subunit SctD [Ramlibacter sp.]
MSQAEPLELRILSGIHQGASAALAGTGLLIGGAPECDIVLADAGVHARHARLEPGEGGWCLLAAQGAQEGAPVLLQPGVAAMVGPVTVTVDAPGAPWPEPEQLKLAQAVASAAEPADAPPALTTAAEGVPADTEAAAPVPADPMPAESSSAVSLPRRRRSWSALTAGLLMLCAAAALLAWSMEVEPPVAAVTLGAPMAPPTLAAQKVIDDLALGQRAVVERQGDQVLVRATYLSDSEAETLAAALSRLRPRPGLRMTSEQDLQQEVADSLARLQPGQPGQVKAVYLGDARFRLEGRLPGEAERKELEAALRAAHPQVHGWDNQLLVPQDLGEHLLAQLRAAGFDEISGRWQEGRLHIGARVPRSQVPQWERALVQAVARYPIPVQATLTAERQSDNEALGRLPFGLRSVMGGDTPYVVLADGGKLMVDGQRQGWRLVSVEADKVVFENGTRRAVIAR